MEFIRTNIDTNNKKAVYKMTKAAGKSVKDVEGIFPVVDYLIYTDTNARGEDHKVLAFTTEGGAKLSTISSSFIEGFEEILDIMDGDPFSVVISHVTSKAGRVYVTCGLDC